jgi:pilus assembly protein CpaE
MKVAVISPNTVSLQELARQLKAVTPDLTVGLHEGGVGQIRMVADQQQPDLIIVDNMCRDIGDLQLVEYVSTQHPQTAIVMACSNQTPEFLMNAMRVGVREVLQSPVSADALAACVGRVEQRLGLRSQSKQPGQVLAMIPCKGGSGCTFLATNLGYQLAAENKKVLLIDLNLQFGDAVLFVHDQRPSHTLADIAHNIARLDASFLSGTLVNISPNFAILSAPEDPAHATEIKPDHLEVLLNLAVKQYDFVVLDLGRNLDAVTITALDRADFIFPVVQMTLPFLRDAGRLLATFRSLNYAKEKIRLIVNRYDKKDEIGLDDLKRTLGVPPFKAVPNSYDAVATSVNQGRPLASFARNNAVTKALQEIAQQLATPPAQGAAFLRKLVRRSS